jgi:hypothetical protein
MNPVTLVRLWRKHLPDLKEDGLQGFPNEEVGKFEILDMECAMRSFENVNKDNVEEWLQSDTCELGFQELTDTDICQCCHETKGRRTGWGG